MDYVVALAQVVKGLAGGKGAGIFWWAAEYQTLSGFNLAGFNRRSLFGSGGNIMPAADALGQLSLPIVMSVKPVTGGLKLTWPFSGAGLSLVTTTNLSPLALWQTLPDPIQSTGGVFSVTMPMDLGPGRLYRLQLK